MDDRGLSIAELEYVADMLRAIVWVKDEFDNVSNESIEELERSLKVSEAALRRVAAELAVTEGKSAPPH